MANTRIDKSTTGAIENMNAALKHHCRPEPELGHEVGCVLALPFRYLDGEKFMDRSAYGHLCTNHGSKWQLDGRYFDGVGNYVDCGVASVLHFSKAFTVGALLSIPTNPASLDAQIVADYNGLYKGYRFTVIPESKVLFGIGRSKTMVSASSVSALVLNRKHFIGGFYDDTRANACLDQEITQGDPFSPIEAETGNVLIGRDRWWAEDAHKYFKGTIEYILNYSFADYIPRILSRSIGG